MSASRSLRGRVAGQSAMSAVVIAQQSAEPLGRFAWLFGSSPLSPRAKASYRGALGELLVGDLLQNLGSTWDVLHDLPWGAGVVDHLVIGPAGVFTVRVVNCSYCEVVVDGHTLTVDGEERGDMSGALDEADAASRRLSAAAGDTVPASPVVVLVDPRRLVVRAPSVGVQVVASHELHRSFLGRPRVLAGDDVARISDLADLESTWSTAGSPPTDTPQLHRDFSEVRHQVTRARTRRVFWGVVSVAVVYALAWGAITAFVATIVRA